MKFDPLAQVEYIVYTIPPTSPQANRQHPCGSFPPRPGCHSRRESASAFARSFVIPEGNLHLHLPALFVIPEGNLRLHLPALFVIPEGNLRLHSHVLLSFP